MACPESSLDTNNRHRNDSGELDVFEATRYFSGYGDVVLVSSNKVPNPDGYFPSMSNKEARYSNTSLSVPMTRAHVASNGAVVRGVRDHVSKDKMLRFPSSPGGKIVRFMKSLFDPSSPAEGGIGEKKVKKTTTTMTRSLKDQGEINPGGWRRRRRSSMGHFWASSAVADSKSLPSINGTVPSFSYVNSGSRTPPPSTFVDTPWNNSRSLSDHQQVTISVSIRNRAREEFAEWKASSVVKEASNSADCKDDGNESDSSSDLFELPVYDSTRIESIRRSSISTVSTGSTFMKTTCLG